MAAPESAAPFVFEPDYYQRLRDLERTSWWNAGMRDVAPSLFGLLPLPLRGRVLDVGCGSGQTMAWFHGLYPGWQPFGLDLAAEGVTAVRSGGLMAVMQASALDLPVATA